MNETKKLDNFFTIVCRTESLRQTEFWFVALTHYNKQNVYLSQWGTATNKICICYQKVPKNKNKKCKIRHKSPKKWQRDVKSANKLRTVDTFGTFLATYANFVCRSDSVRQTFLFVCCSDSVQQTKFLFVKVTQCNKQYWQHFSIY